VTVLRGKNLDATQIVACLKKAAADPKLQPTVKMKPAGEAGAAAKSAAARARARGGKPARGAKKSKDKGGRTGSKKGSPPNKAAAGAARASQKAERPSSSGKAAAAVRAGDQWDVKVTAEKRIMVFRLTVLSPHKIAFSSGEWTAMPKKLAAGQKPTVTAKSHIIKLYKSLAPVNIFWAASLGLPPRLKSRLPAVAAVNKIRSLGAGLEGRSDAVVIKLDVDMRKAKNAASLASVLKSALPGLDKFLPALSKLSAILKKINISAEGHILKVSLELTDKDLETIEGLVKRVLTSGILEMGG
jgi:hypothetical protein